MKGHPNATVAAGGTGAAAILAAILQAAGVDLNPILLTAIGGLIPTAVLFVGRNGVRGLIRLVWRGDGKK